MPGGRHTDLNSRNVLSVLDAALMRHLRSVGLARGVLLNELHLYALAQSFRSWTDEPLLRLDFEQHGRTCLFFNNRINITTRPNTQPEVRMRGLPRIQMKKMEFLGSSQHENLVSYDLMIECDGSNEFAVVNWIYSSAIHHEETINVLSKRFLDSLRALQ